jgi:hypothetical protein
LNCKQTRSTIRHLLYYLQQRNVVRAVARGLSFLAENLDHFSARVVELPVAVQRKRRVRCRQRAPDFVSDQVELGFGLERVVRRAAPHPEPHPGFRAPLVQVRVRLRDPGQAVEQLLRRLQVGVHLRPLVEPPRDLGAAEQATRQCRRVRERRVLGVVDCEQLQRRCEVGEGARGSGTARRCAVAAAAGCFGRCESRRA